MTTFTIWRLLLSEIASSMYALLINFPIAQQFVLDAHVTLILFVSPHFNNWRYGTRITGLGTITLIELGRTCRQLFFFQFAGAKAGGLQYKNRRQNNTRLLE